MRSGGDLFWCVEILIFCVIKAINSIDKLHAFLRKEKVLKYSTNLGINVGRLANLSFLVVVT